MASAQNPGQRARMHVLHCVGECIEVLGAGHASMQLAWHQASTRGALVSLVCVL